MSSILDHVEQAVPRATVYGAMKGSPVFIGKYFREVNAASNAQSYSWTSGERKITFILASPDKTIFNDMRSAYLRVDIADVTGTAVNKIKISEPASNIIGRIVIKMNGTVVEDISDFDRLQSFFKRSLLKREEKNARGREGWDYVDHPATNLGSLATPVVGDTTVVNLASTQTVTTIAAAFKKITDDINSKVTDATVGAQPFETNNVPGKWLTEQRGIKGDRLTLKLDLSGIFNVQQLLSAYYSPLEIDLYLQDPAVCCQSTRLQGGADASIDANLPMNYEISGARLCIDQIVMSPEYVSAFEAALLANSSAQGIQIPFTTYYTYRQNISATANNKPTFWIRRPVRYLKGVYWGAYPSTFEQNSADSYRPVRVYPHTDRVKSSVSSGLDRSNSAHIAAWRIAIGTKNYREISDVPGVTTAGSNHRYKFHCNESQLMFAKAVGHQNDYATETSEFNATQKPLNNAVQGIDLEFSPDNDVLASETTLNSNDVRLEITTVNSSGIGNSTYNIYTFLQYQASIALFPGNETRLLVT